MRIIYPGTFDPITNGHVDVIARAAGIFAEVMVGVSASTHKTPHFSAAERLAMCQQALLSFKNVTVMRFDGLLIAFARQQHVQLILRGVRTGVDFDYEFQLAGVNRSMAPDIETIFLASDIKTACVSGTIVRDILRHGGDISEFVPAAVVAYLKKSA